MTNPPASLRSDYCPIWTGIGVRQLLESVSDFIGIRTGPLARGFWDLPLPVEVITRKAKAILPWPGNLTRIVFSWSVDISRHQWLVESKPVDGTSFRFSQMGPDFLLVESAIDHPPCQAVIELQVDDSRRSWGVRLPFGMTAGESRVVLSGPEEQRPYLCFGGDWVCSVTGSRP